MSGRRGRGGQSGARGTSGALRSPPGDSCVSAARGARPSAGTKRGAACGRPTLRLPHLSPVAPGGGGLGPGLAPGATPGRRQEGLAASPPPESSLPAASLVPGGLRRLRRRKPAHSAAPGRPACPGGVAGAAGPSGAGLCGPARALPLPRPSCPDAASPRPPSPRGLPGPPARGWELTSSRLLLPPARRFRVTGAGRFSRCGVGGLAGMTALDPPPSPAARKRLPVPTPHTRGRGVRASGPQDPFPGGLGGGWASKGHALLSTGLLARGSSYCGDEGPGPGLRRPSL